MSRTYRDARRARWVLRDMKHRNNYINGYRGEDFTYCSRGASLDYSTYRIKGVDVTSAQLNENNSLEVIRDSWRSGLKFKNSIDMKGCCGWLPLTAYLCSKKFPVCPVAPVAPVAPVSPLNCDQT